MGLVTQHGGRRTGRAGSAALETLILLPLYLFVALGLIDLTRIFDVYLSLTRVAYECARAGNRVSPLILSDGSRNPELQRLVAEIVEGTFGAVPAGFDWSVAANALTGSGGSQTNSLTLSVQVPVRLVAVSWLSLGTTPGEYPVRVAATAPLLEGR